MELQEQTNAYSRDLRSVKTRLMSLQREARVNSVTTNQVHRCYQCFDIFSVSNRIQIYSTLLMHVIVKALALIECHFVQISEMPEATPLYRSVGKAFLKTDREEIEKKLEEEISHNTKSQRDLVDRQEYLERRIKSNTENLRDLTAGM